MTRSDYFLNRLMASLTCMCLPPCEELGGFLASAVEMAGTLLTPFLSQPAIAPVPDLVPATGVSR